MGTRLPVGPVTRAEGEQILGPQTHPGAVGCGLTAPNCPHGVSPQRLSSDLLPLLGQQPPPRARVLAPVRPGWVQEGSGELFISP